MRYLFAFPIVFILISCAPPEDHRVKYVEALIIDFAEEQILRTNDLYSRATSIANPLAVSPNDIRLIQRNHTLNQAFFNQLDSIPQQFTEELDANTKQALVNTSLSVSQKLFSLLPNGIGPELVQNEFPVVQNSSRAKLVVSSMKIQLARQEFVILSFLIGRNSPSLNVPDTSGGVSSKTFSSTDGSHCFSLHSKFIQQYRFREIFIDSVLRDGELIHPRIQITDDDILYTVELKSLLPGAYRVSGGNSSKDYVHAFTIR